MKKNAKIYTLLTILATVGVITSATAIRSIKQPINEDSKVTVIPGLQAKAIGFEISKAIGQEGVKTITLNIQPANADVGVITWSSDSVKVKITPATDGKSAQVYVTEYYKDFATISVHESYSDITATGKIYSLGAFDIPQTNHNASYDFILDATASQLAITSTSSTEFNVTQEVKTLKHAKLVSNNANGGYYSWQELMTSKRSLIHSGWTFPQTKVWIHLSYYGSYSPVIFNKTTGVIYNGNDLKTYDKIYNAAGEIGKVLSVAIDLAAGDNMILIAGRNHTLPTQTNITASEFLDPVYQTLGDELVTFKSAGVSSQGNALPLILTNAAAPTSITLPDTIFYE